MINKKDITHLGVAFATFLLIIIVCLLLMKTFDIPASNTAQTVIKYRITHYHCQGPPDIYIAKDVDLLPNRVIIKNGIREEVETGWQLNVPFAYLYGDVSVVQIVP